MVKEQTSRPSISRRSIQLGGAISLGGEEKLLRDVLPKTSFRLDGGMHFNALGIYMAPRERGRNLQNSHRMSPLRNYTRAMSALGDRALIAKFYYE